MDIIVVRHGQTEANKSGVIGTDSNLTEEGKQQAKELGDKLSREQIDVIYCSPLKRTSQTALPLAEKLGREIFIDERIREVDWGDFDGLPGSFFKKTIGMEPRDSLDSYAYDFHQHHGESSADVERRVRSFVDELRTKPYGKVLIITHGGIVRMLHYVITGEKILYQPNAKVINLKI